MASHYQDYSVGGNTGFDITQNDHFAGNGALQQFYRSGQVDAGWISWFYADALGQNYSGEHNTIFFRWYHKFETGFEGTPPKMTRIRRLEAGYVKSNAVHIWVDTNSSFLPLVADIYAPDSTQANNTGWFTFDSNFHYSNPANIGRWICHEVQLTNNTPGLSDGNVKIWVDNNMIINQENVDLRGNTNKAFNEIMLDTYWNGGSPKEQSRYFDNFVIATQRIGCQEVD